MRSLTKDGTTLKRTPPQKEFRKELAMALRRSFTNDQVTNRAIPLHSFMDYKFTSSRCPAKAVGYPAQSHGADGDSGGTAGTSLAGVEAASVSNNHESEIPHPAAPRRSATGSNHDPPPALNSAVIALPQKIPEWPNKAKQGLSRLV